MGLAWQASQLHPARSAQIRRSLTEARARQRPSGDLARGTIPSVANTRAVMSIGTAGGCGARRLM